MARRGLARNLLQKLVERHFAEVTMHDIDRTLLESEQAEQGIASGDERENGEFSGA
jgi:hypothetical protein